MLNVYERYRDKGFEIVSVYIDERGNEATQITTVRNYVEGRRLPWIIISEALTVRAGLPLQRETFRKLIGEGVPAMFLFDKDGNLINANANTRDGVLQSELRRLFGE